MNICNPKATNAKYAICTTDEELRKAINFFVEAGNKFTDDVNTVTVGKGKIVAVFQTKRDYGIVKLKPNTEKQLAKLKSEGFSKFSFTGEPEEAPVKVKTIKAKALIESLQRALEASSSDNPDVLYYGYNNTDEIEEVGFLSGDTETIVLLRN